MIKFYSLLIILLIASGNITQAQLAHDSWGFGFGFQYPRLESANINASNSNYGGYLSIQNNFSEHFGLRLKGGFAHLEGEYADRFNNTITSSTNLISGDLDFMYYLIPCEDISPYLFAGAGVNYRMLTNNATASLDANAIGSQFNLGGGVEWAIDSDWDIVTEYGYHKTGNSELDGAVINGELNPRDAFWNVSLGVLYSFSYGAPSTLCEPCTGLDQKDLTDYKKIEEMIKQHIPKEVVKEVVVYKNIAKVSEDRMELDGVNFAFGKSDLLPESYPVLDDAVKMLNDAPDVKVEIEGYTDYIGSKKYNDELSVQRAETVKAYLVSKGIAESRLSTVGYGKSNPVGDNETEKGRAQNRRIIFRIL